MSDTYLFFTQLLHPFTLLMLFLGVCIFWPQKAGASRRWGLKLCYLAVYLYCTPVVAYTATWWLERDYPPDAARPENLDAVVVLGGSYQMPLVPGERIRLHDNSLMRCERAADLYHAGPALPILITGGELASSISGPPISEVMAEYLAKLNVPAADILIENQSRTTEENANLSVPIIRDRGWQRIALVTSAMHLVRGQRLFHRQGVETIPVGCQYRTPEFEWNAFAFLPRSRAVARHEEAWHEFLGCAFLMVRGKW